MTRDVILTTPPQIFNHQSKSETGYPHRLKQIADYGQKETLSEFGQDEGSAIRTRLT